METIRIILEIQSKKRLSTHSIQHQQTFFYICASQHKRL